MSPIHRIFQITFRLPPIPWGTSAVNNTGYSVCTNRCNIRRCLVTFLSAVTSHQHAVQYSESSVCYNLRLVNDRSFLQSLCSYFPHRLQQLLRIHFRQTSRRLPIVSSASPPAISRSATNVLAFGSSLCPSLLRFRRFSVSEYFMFSVFPGATLIISCYR